MSETIDPDGHDGQLAADDNHDVTSPAATVGDQCWRPKPVWLRLLVVVIAIYVGSVPFLLFGLAWLIAPVYQVFVLFNLVGYDPTGDGWIIPAALLSIGGIALATWLGGRFKGAIIVIPLICAIIAFILSVIPLMWLGAAFR